MALPEGGRIHHRAAVQTHLEALRQEGDQTHLEALRQEGDRSHLEALRQEGDRSHLEAPRLGEDQIHPEDHTHHPQPARVHSYSWRRIVTDRRQRCQRKTRVVTDIAKFCSLQQIAHRSRLRSCSAHAR